MFLPIAPSSSPAKFSATNISAHSISLAWESPKPITGIITDYNIAYSYNTDSCGPSNILSNQTHPVNGTETTYQMMKLLPFWTYVIRITASTSKGFGPFTEELNLTTAESSKYMSKIY